MPLIQNLVYINISKGDYFGDIDYVFEAKKNGLEINDMIKLLNTESQKLNLIRYFTV